MATETEGTLYGAIKDHARFERVVSEGVAIELKKLGDGIYDLDWASVIAHRRNTPVAQAA